MTCFWKTIGFYLSLNLTGSSVANEKFSNCYFTVECLFSFECTYLSNRMFELYSNQEGQNLTKIIRASKLHSALPKILTLPISRKKKSYMQANKPITCNKGNCYSPVYLHLVQPTASVKVLRK